jgi:response regulator NasT
MLRVMIIDESSKREAMLRDSLEKAGYEIVASVQSSMDLLQKVTALSPDIVIIDTESPSRDTLEHLCAVSRDKPKPIVMFSEDGTSDMIKAAVRAGVTAYVVDGLSNERLQPILDVAVARFEEYQALKSELAEANTRLSDRKTIERAKGILMEQRGMGEDEAYRTLRKLAMDRNLRLADLAGQIVAAAELLIKL